MTSPQGIICQYCGTINNPDTVSLTDVGQYEGNPPTLKRRNGSQRAQPQKSPKCVACGKPLLPRH